MAKNVTDDTQNKIKKRGFFCTCCLVIMFINFVLFVSVIGVGYFLGNKYTKEYFDMSVGEVLGVVNGLYGANEKNIVSNKYTDQDKEAFYSGLKKQLFLDEDTDLDFTAIIDLMLEQKDKAQASDESGSGSGDEEESDDIMQAIMDYFVSLIVDNIDLELLKSYESENAEEYIFTFTDKSLAAVFNDIMLFALTEFELEDVSDEVELPIDISLSEIGNAVSFDQLVFTKGTAADGAEYTQFKITASVYLEDLADTIIDSLDFKAFNWTKGTAKFLKNLIFPKRIFLTLTMPVNNPNEPIGIKINNMNEKYQQNTIKLINGVMNMSEPEERFDFNEYLSQALEKVQEVFDMMGKVADLESEQIRNGSISLDIFDLLGEIITEQLQSSEPVTGSELIYTLQALLTSDSQKALIDISGSSFKRWAKADGVLVYVVDEIYDNDGNLVQYKCAYGLKDNGGIYYHNVNANKVVFEDYQKAFEDEFRSKYFIKDNIGFEDILDIFTGGANADFMDMFDSQKLKAGLNVDPDDSKMQITAQMLGAIFTSQIEEFMPDEYAGLLNLEAVSTIKKTPSTQDGFASGYNTEHTLVMIAVSIDLKEVLANNEAAALFKDIVSSRSLITVTFDITANVSKRIETLIQLNDYQKTEIVLNLITKLAPELDFYSIFDDAADFVIDAFDKMGSQLTDINIGNGKIEISDIFTMMADLVFNNADFILEDEAGNAISKGKAVQQMFKGLFEDVNIVSNVADNYDRFIDEELKDKFYLNAPVNSDADKSRFEALLDILAVGGAGFDSDIFNLEPDNGIIENNVKYLFHDNRPVTALKPYMYEEEVAALFTELVSNNSAQISGLNLVRLEIGDNTLTLVFALDINEIMDADTQQILGISNLYLTAVIDLNQEFTDDISGDKYYKTDIKINDMTSIAQQNLFRAVSSLMGENAYDFEQNAMEIGKVIYDQFNEINKSLAGNENIKAFNFTDGKMELLSFYEFLSAAFNINSDAELVKNAVQSLYQYIADGSDYNYETADFIHNILANDGELATAITQIALGSTKIMNDRLLGALLQAGLSKNVSNDISVEQAVLLAQNNNNEDIIRYLNSFGLGEFDNRSDDFLMLTFNLSFDRFSGVRETSSDSVEDFVPNDLYATVLLRLDESGNFVIHNESGADWIRINGMEYDAQQVIYTMMGFDFESGFSIKNIVNSCFGYLSMFDGISIENTQSSGIGQIRFTSADTSGLGGLLQP